jgi:hypothetical protein
MATLLGVSFVIHKMGSVIGAWGGGMIFDMFSNYDLAWRFGVSIGIVAGRGKLTVEHLLFTARAL